MADGVYIVFDEDDVIVRFFSFIIHVRQIKCLLFGLAITVATIGWHAFDIKGVKNT